MVILLASIVLPYTERLDDLKELRREQDRNIRSALAKGDIERAERGIILAVSYGESKYELGEYRADIAYRLSDYTEMRKQLKLFFEGEVEGKRSVGGAYTAEAWYWYLTLKSGDTSKAKKLFDRIASNKSYSLPNSGKRMDITTFATSDLNRVLLFLSAIDMKMGYYIRGRFYFDQSKLVDPSFAIPVGFSEYLDRPASEREEDMRVESSYYRFSRFDPLKLEKRK